MSTTSPDGMQPRWATSASRRRPSATSSSWWPAPAPRSGLGAIAWPLIDSMNPASDVLALSSIEVDLSSITEGMGITAVWRGKPIFVRHRTPEEIKTVEAVPLNAADRAGDRPVPHQGRARRSGSC